MEITDTQYRHIKRCLATQRGNVTLDNLQILNAILYVAEQACKWRGLPKRFGNWYTIYTRMNRWAKSGVLDRVFTKLQQAQIIRVKLEAVALDSTIVKVHPDGTGALKKKARKPLAGLAVDGPPRFIWLPRMLERPLMFALSPGQAHDAPRDTSCCITSGIGRVQSPLLMDRAYEGDETRQLAVELGYVPVVPPKHNRCAPWDYDQVLYKRRNEIERLSRRLK